MPRRLAGCGSAEKPKAERGLLDDARPCPRERRRRSRRFVAGSRFAARYSSNPGTSELAQESVALPRADCELRRLSLPAVRSARAIEERGAVERVGDDLAIAERRERVRDLPLASERCAGNLVRRRPTARRPGCVRSLRFARPLRSGRRRSSRSRRHAGGVTDRASLVSAGRHAAAERARDGARCVRPGSRGPATRCTSRTRRRIGCAGATGLRRTRAAGTRVAPSSCKSCAARAAPMSVNAGASDFS